MNAELALIAGLLASIATLTTVLTAVWRALSAIAALKDGIAETNGRLERLELIANGDRERIEHINTRVSTHRQRLDDALDEVDTAHPVQP